MTKQIAVGQNIHICTVLVQRFRARVRCLTQSEIDDIANRLLTPLDVLTVEILERSVDEYFSFVCPYFLVASPTLFIRDPPVVGFTLRAFLILPHFIELSSRCIDCPGARLNSFYRLVGQVHVAPASLKFKHCRFRQISLIASDDAIVTHTAELAISLRVGYAVAHECVCALPSSNFEYQKSLMYSDTIAVTLQPWFTVSLAVLAPLFPKPFPAQSYDIFAKYFDVKLLLSTNRIFVTCYSSISWVTPNICAPFSSGNIPERNFIAIFHPLIRLYIGWGGIRGKAFMW